MAHHTCTHTSWRWRKFSRCCSYFRARRELDIIRLGIGGGDRVDVRSGVRGKQWRKEEEEASFCLLTAEDAGIAIVDWNGQKICVRGVKKAKGGKENHMRIYIYPEADVCRDRLCKACWIPEFEPAFVTDIPSIQLPLHREPTTGGYQIPVARVWVSVTS